MSMNLDKLTVIADPKARPTPVATHSPAQDHSLAVTERRLMVATRGNVCDARVPSVFRN